MPENGMPGPVCDLSSVKESVCIHTKKILDGCRDKDCVEDLRFYPTQAAQEVLSGTQIIKGGCAELLYVYTDVEPITFNRGFYSIDMRYFYRVTLQVATGTPRSRWRVCAYLTNAVFSLAARGAPRASPLTLPRRASYPRPDCPPPWLRPWTPSFWTPELWRTARQRGYARAIYRRSRRLSRRSLQAPLCWSLWARADIL